MTLNPYLLGPPIARTSVVGVFQRKAVTGRVAACVPYLMWLSHQFATPLKESQTPGVSASTVGPLHEGVQHTHHRPAAVNGTICGQPRTGKLQSLQGFREPKTL